MDVETNEQLPEMHTDRIEIEGDRYLIYYTFDQAGHLSSNNPTEHE